LKIAFSQRTCKLSGIDFHAEKNLWIDFLPNPIGAKSIFWRMASNIGFLLWHDP